MRRGLATILKYLAFFIIASPVIIGGGFSDLGHIFMAFIFALPLGIIGVSLEHWKDSSEQKARDKQAKNIIDELRK